MAYKKPPEEYKWKKGQSGNPKGRAVEKSLKEFARDYLRSLDEEGKREFLASLPPELVWRMAEGNPMQGSDITTGGESLKAVLVKFIDGRNNDGNSAGVQEAV